jgi:hypothetical protein
MASSNSRPNWGSSYFTEFIQVPSKACGLIVGSKGQNIKELQQMQGIQHMSVDFQRSTVKVVGTDVAIIDVKRHIDQAVSLATNAAGYFPENTLTCLRFNSDL